MIRDPVALLGAIFATVGTGIAVIVHLVIGNDDPPPPWAPWRAGEFGPVDMVSRVWTEALPVEIGMVGIAIGVGAWVWWRTGLTR